MSSSSALRLCLIPLHFMLGGHIRIKLMDPIKTRTRKPTVEIHLVTSPDSPEFAHLSRSLACSSIIALDAEWKPSSSSSASAAAVTSSRSFPDVTLLQLACQLAVTPDSSDSATSSPVFLLDFLSLPLDSVWNLLKEVFASPDVLKLGFRFKQDLVYLSSTFCGRGCDPGFDRLEPYFDATSMHAYLQPKRSGRKKDTKSLASVCEELLGYTLSKELQCSDWSQRPLTKEQKEYAARDAHCLLEIYSIFQAKTLTRENGLQGVLAVESSRTNLGPKDVLTELDTSIPVLRTRFFEASLVMHSITSGFEVVNGTDRLSCRRITPMDEPLSYIIRKYGGKILLTESDRRPKISKKKGKRKPLVAITDKEKREIVDEWQGPPPWDFSVGGDGHPKFLCDVMVEGLAKHLRCVGIDAAIPCFKRPEARELIVQADREKRVLLTRDAKLLRHEHLIPNQIYRVKSLLKNDQLLEVIETFQLRISEDQLMSRCTKCNGRFIQKPLTTEEAVEAAKGFQRIPNCLFDKNLEFWQCMDCNQLYWEGTQYHNAVQKFTDVCKLND